jgi:hypothetical protein
MLVRKNITKGLRYQIVVRLIVRGFLGFGVSRIIKPPKQHSLGAGVHDPNSEILNCFRNSRRVDQVLHTLDIGFTACLVCIDGTIIYPPTAGCGS